MTKREIKRWLKAVVKSMPAEESSSFLGTVTALDPCGRYHHVISPNSLSNRCERYWENLDNVASELGGFIEFGEGDALDVYFQRSVSDGPYLIEKE